MRRFPLKNSSTRLALGLIVAVALTGCGSEVNFNPMAPSFQPFPLGTERSVGIVGTLTALQGAAVEATILYDGQELAGARVECAETNGCAKLDLSGVARSASGHHTISFRVLRQAAETVSYLAQATISVSRDGSSQVVNLVLDPTRATLKSGQTVSFDVDFRNSLD